MKVYDRINIVPAPGDIASPANGDIWYNSTTGKFRKMQDGDITDLDEQISGNSVVTNRRTSDYTLVLTDVNKLIELNSASAISVTIPRYADVAIPVESQLLIVQYGAGQGTIVAGSGVTLRSAGGKLKLNSQYSAATLIKIATDEWYVFGDLKT